MFTAEETAKMVQAVEEARGIAPEQPTEATKEWLEYNNKQATRPDLTGRSLGGTTPPAARTKLSGKEI